MTAKSGIYFHFLCQKGGYPPPVVLRGGLESPPPPGGNPGPIGFTPLDILQSLDVNHLNAKLICYYRDLCHFHVKLSLCVKKMFNYYNHHHYHWRRRQRQSLVNHQMCHHRHCYLDHQQGCQLVCWGKLNLRPYWLYLCPLPPSHAD